MRDHIVEDEKNIFIIMSFMIMFFVAVIGYMMWLDVGCEIQGVMTWEGKSCVEDLPDTL